MKLEHYGIKGMHWGIRKYDPPYSSKEVKKKYGEKTYKRLKSDPAHNYRMKTGIELIHKEPTKKELKRIYKNWKLMTPEQKKKSDAMSYELFGVSNEMHYRDLINNAYTKTGGLFINSHILHRS